MNQYEDYFDTELIKLMTKAIALDALIYDLTYYN